PPLAVETPSLLEYPSLFSRHPCFAPWTLERHPRSLVPRPDRSPEPVPCRVLHSPLESVPSPSWLSDHPVHPLHLSESGRDLSLGQRSALPCLAHRGMASKAPVGLLGLHPISAPSSPAFVYPWIVFLEPATIVHRFSRRSAAISRPSALTAI